jgi:hypothetical protein
MALTPLNWNIVRDHFTRPDDKVSSGRQWLNTQLFSNTPTNLATKSETLVADFGLPVYDNGIGPSNISDKWSTTKIVTGDDGIIRVNNVLVSDDDGEASAVTLTSESGKDTIGISGYLKFEAGGGWIHSPFVASLFLLTDTTTNAVDGYELEFENTIEANPDVVTLYRVTNGSRTLLATEDLDSYTYGPGTTLKLEIDNDGEIRVYVTNFSGSFIDAIITENDTTHTGSFYGGIRVPDEFIGFSNIRFGGYNASDLESTYSGVTKYATTNGPARAAIIVDSGEISAGSRTSIFLVTNYGTSNIFGYELRYTESDSALSVYRWNNGVPTQLATETVDFENYFNILDMIVENGVISVYGDPYDPPVIEVNDSTFTGGFYTAILTNDIGVRMRYLYFGPPTDTYSTYFQEEFSSETLNTNPLYWSLIDRDYMNISPNGINTSKVTNFSGRRVYEIGVTPTDSNVAWSAPRLNKLLDISDPKARAVKITMTTPAASVYTGARVGLSTNTLVYDPSPPNGIGTLWVPYPSDELYPGMVFPAEDEFDYSTIFVEFTNSTCNIKAQKFFDHSEILIQTFPVAANKTIDVWFEINSKVIRILVDNQEVLFNGSIVGYAPDIDLLFDPNMAVVTNVWSAQNGLNASFKIHEILAFQSIPEIPVNVKAEVISISTIMYSMDPANPDEFVHTYKYTIVDTPYVYENPTPVQTGDMLPAGTYDLEAVTINPSPFWYLGPDYDGDEI